MPVAACPTCGAETETTSRSAPFCSVRCARVDLGRWLSGRYAVPAETAPEGTELEALEQAVEEGIAEGRIIAGPFRRGGE